VTKLISVVQNKINNMLTVRSGRSGVKKLADNRDSFSINCNFVHGGKGDGWGRAGEEKGRRGEAEPGS